MDNTTLFVILDTVLVAIPLWVLAVCNLAILKKVKTTG